MITRKFIETVHVAFDELGYHETETLIFDDFRQSAIRTLIHCKELGDAKTAIFLFQFCVNNWRKINKMFSRKLHKFNEYKFQGNSLISLVVDDEAIGTYFVTNGINQKVNEICVASQSLDEKMIEFALGHRKFSFFEDGDYYIKYSKMSSKKMKLFDRQKKCLCNIVLSEKLGIFLENNRTPYDLIVYDDFIGIYDRCYIDSLAPNDIIDTNRLRADIKWDIIKEDSDLGVAKLNLYDDNVDSEMLWLFASSTFLLFRKHMQAQSHHLRAQSRVNRIFMANILSKR